MRLPLLLELAETNLQELIVHGDKSTVENIVGVGDPHYDPSDYGDDEEE